MKNIKAGEWWWYSFSDGIEPVKVVYADKDTVIFWEYDFYLVPLARHTSGHHNFIGHVEFNFIFRLLGYK